MGSWPPDYKRVMEQRANRLLKINNDKSLVPVIKKHYENNYIDLIQDWFFTYDPRNAKSDIPTYVPFILFPKQKDFINFLDDCIESEESGLLEKSRDMGATWLCCAYSVCMWLLEEGSSIGWGSRKEMLVDRNGDPDSIFEKMRIIIEHLPNWLLPAEFDIKKHATYMKIINPENGATITGESGDNIGRGGRKKVYFKDESAFYERPEKIEASLGDNTNCQIDLSTVHGTATIFHRRREAGEEWGKKKVLRPAEHGFLYLTGGITPTRPKNGMISAARRQRMRDCCTFLHKKSIETALRQLRGLLFLLHGLKQPLTRIKDLASNAKEYLCRHLTSQMREEMRIHIVTERAVY